MILIYALAKEETRTYMEDLLGELEDYQAKDIHPLIAYYKKKGYHSFRIVDHKDGKPNFINTVSI
jgi:hypothetical protein